jgi:DNA-3-methyladenine glycosylase II
MLQQAINQLKKQDSEIKILLESLTIQELKPAENYFISLVKNIIYQQLSGNVANVIFNRFLSLFPSEKHPTPEDIMLVSTENFRSVGLSASKANYLKNISNAFIDGTFDYKNIDKYNDNEIIAQLIKIKGIGKWTAQMFLIFNLNRLDVFPSGDRGVQKGFQKYFELKNIPSSKEMLSRAIIWKPYRTVMTLYFWKLTENL